MIFGDRPGAVEVRGEEEVVEAVRAARQEEGRIRATGSGGSKNEATAIPGTALRLSDAEGLLGVDGRLVTAPAGMTSGRLHELLRPHGLALPTVGEWKNATLAGALATATHGGSARHGIMATSVRGLRLVTGTGEVWEVGPGDPDFPHVAVSLGALGIVTSVTLECVDRFALELETDVVPFDEYVRDPVTQESRREFHASVWVPWAGRVIRFGARRTAGPPDGTGVAKREERFGNRTALATFLSRRLGLDGVVSNRFFERTAVDDCAEILSPLEVSSAKARFRNAANELRRRRAAELAIPAARAREALVRFREFFLERGGPLNNPIGLRMTAADTFTLSPCTGRDTLWLDLFYDENESFERDLAAVADGFEARCHWGKALALPPGKLRERYPGWPAFRAARARLDPDGVFANAFTDALGLTNPGVASSSP